MTSSSAFSVEEELVRCDHCGDMSLAEHCEVFDASDDDEYYPDFKYICPDCQRDPMGAWS